MGEVCCGERAPGKTRLEAERFDTEGGLRVQLGTTLWDALYLSYAPISVCAGTQRTHAVCNPWAVAH